MPRHGFITVIFVSLFSLLLSSQANAFNKSIGKGYCALRHPTESLTSDRVSCESQHIVQQQHGGLDDKNTIWINTTHHDYLDRSVDKPWEKERPWLNFGDSNLERAYMMGTYANGYHFFTYDHHGDGALTLFTWDGMSHATYVVSSIANFITKEMSYIGYQMDRGGKGQKTQYIDAVIGIFIDLIEVIFGVFYGLLGIIVGTIFNPIDTITNIPGALTLSVESIVEGVANTGSDIVSLFTLGFVEL